MPQIYTEKLLPDLMLEYRIYIFPHRKYCVSAQDKSIGTVYCMDEENPQLSGVWVGELPTQNVFY